MQLRFLVASVAITATATGSAALAAAGDVYTAMDGIGDGIVSEGEFRQYSADSDIFATWDTTGDGHIGDLEWENGADDYGDADFWDI